MRKKLNHKILAKGEHTGHAHIASGGTLFEEGDALILVNDTDIEITHNEHRKQVIPPGEYRIGRIEEVDPFTLMYRQVSD